MEKRDRWTPMQALSKMAHWCAYAERSHSDARQHLYAHGLNQLETETIITRLIEEDFLNEERYAIAFAGGHFRMKHWGRRKITHALRQKQVSDYCIKKALAQIDDDAYLLVLDKLARNKWNSIGKSTPAQRFAKTRSFLLQRGFEYDLVNDQLKQLTK